MKKQKSWDCKLALIDDQRICYTGINEQQCHAPIKLDPLQLDLLKRFNLWIGEDLLSKREDLELLGRLLYSVLFPTEGEDPKQNPRSLFESDYRLFWRQKNEGDRLRLTLELHQDAGELSKLPWEFLFMAEDKSGSFLAGEKTDLILTRFVPNVTPVLEVKTEEPLRILLIFSHPAELEVIDSKLTRDLIEDIKALVSLKHIEVREEENPTHDKLRQLMNSDEVRSDKSKKPEDRSSFRPDIIHFIGHGEPGKLALMRDKDHIQADIDAEGSSNEADWCDSSAILQLFQKHTPRLVFLHACDGAKPSTVAGLSNLARDLVYAKVPVVVAMQYSIKNKDAALFATTFYTEIRKGGRIDEAVQAGRVTLGKKQDALGAWSDRRFGTPVVYLQKQSNEALIKCEDPEEEPESKAGGKESGAGFDLNLKVPCPNPRCDGKIPLGSKLCVLCDELVMICPQCESKGNYFLISKTVQKCGQCGYRGAGIRTKAASAGEAVQSEKAPLQPADEASRHTPLSPASSSAAPVLASLNQILRPDEAKAG